MQVPSQLAVRRVEPLAADWREFAWQGGRFDTAHRSFTPLVEGTIRLPQYLVLATLQGGARSLQVRAACGHRFEGPERTGAISVVPPNCERRLRLAGVRAKWASLAIDQAVFEQLSAGDERWAPHASCFSNAADPFLFGLLAEMERLQAEDGCLDLSYCDAMTSAAARYLQHRHFALRSGRRQRTFGLPRWQMRRIEEYVEAHLERPIRIAELARLAGCSEGYFHRAFRLACGATPVQFVNHRRIQRAVEILRSTPAIAATRLAERVGFTSPNHFTRLFRRIAGVPLASFRAEAATGPVSPRDNPR
jgi:AraC family transcriptional regulator